MNKEDAKELKKLTILKKTVRGIKKELKKINGDGLEIFDFLCELKKICIEEGSTADEADWLIAYATDLEKL